MNEELLDSVQVAAMLRVTPRAVQKWAKLGKLKGFKAGSDWRFTRAAVEEFVRESTPQPPQNPKVKALAAFAA